MESQQNKYIQYKFDSKRRKNLKLNLEKLIFPTITYLKIEMHKVFTVLFCRVINFPYLHLFLSYLIINFLAMFYFVLLPSFFK